jgi:hypothetical protein
VTGAGVTGFGVTGAGTTGAGATGAGVTGLGTGLEGLRREAAWPSLRACLEALGRQRCAVCALPRRQLWVGRACEWPAFAEAGAVIANADVSHAHVTTIEVAIAPRVLCLST